MSVPTDLSLLREVAAVRGYLAECLRQLDHLEHRLRIEPALGDRRDMRALAGPRSDPFEQALPADEEAPQQPHAQDTPGRFTIQALPLPDAPRDGSEPAALASHDPFADSAPTPAQEPHGAGRDAVEATDSGDGCLDPFAFLCVPPLASSSAGDSGVYRGMHALLGGLDVTTQDEPG